MLTCPNTINYSSEPRHKPLLLIADDDLVSVTMLENIFKIHGFDTITARDGLDCIEMATVKQPDLIFLDVLMPGMDGFDVCDTLINQPATSQIPVVFLSGITGVNSKVRALEMGAVDYITKPYSRSEIIARTKSHLRQSMQTRSVIAGKDRQLDLVRSAQQSLLIKPENFPEAKFAVYYSPICEAGGDYYDVVSTGDGCFAYLVSDFSGHDLGAAFATPALKAIFRQNLGLLRNPNLLLSKLNTGMATLLRSSEYATAVYALLDRVNMKMLISNAGHPPVIHVRTNGIARLIESSGDVIGAFEEIVTGSEEMEVCEGDRFYFFTDGIYERCSSSFYSRVAALDRLRIVCEMSYHLELNDSILNIIDEMVSLFGPVEDDIVLLGCEV